MFSILAKLNLFESGNGESVPLSLPWLRPWNEKVKNNMSYRNEYFCMLPEISQIKLFV